MKDWDVIVVGGGVGGLCAAILLGARGLSVCLLEAASALGGKAGTISLDGVEVDTGPSVLTLPWVFEEVFGAAQMSMAHEIELLQHSPAFRYRFFDGVDLDVHHEVEDTLASVRTTLGAGAASDLEDYLKYSKRIWESAAPHFVMKQAPRMKDLLFGGVSAWGALLEIDPVRTLSSAIDARTKSPHLRKLLKRYATYNGSDVRSAPATLGCIAHVELSLGGYGVRGGIARLVDALGVAAQRVGVVIRLETPVGRILTTSRGVTGVELVGGEVLSSARVVCNADVGQLRDGLLASGDRLFQELPASMSAYNGIYRARRDAAKERTPHSVLFPENYEQEFEDIFDHRRTPRDPAIYLCAQEACHQRVGWESEEPIFCMVNAPALSDDFRGRASAEVQALVRARLVRSGELLPSDTLVWWRTPAELAERFPGSKGALYGAASNGKSAAFLRPGNRVRSCPGLYLASGSAHPGGGLPMVAQSGKEAARAVIQDRR